MEHLPRPMLLWRSWRVWGERLYAPIWNESTAWEPEGRRARCGRDGAHPVPAPECGCGWYGYYDPTAGLLPHPDDRERVLDWSRDVDEQEQLAREMGVSLAGLRCWHARLCARAYDPDGQVVDGLVLVWGGVEAHRSGARAEWARPWGLLGDGLNPAVTERIGRAYGLVTSDDWRSLVAAGRAWGEWIGPDHELRSSDRDFPGVGSR